MFSYDFFKDLLCYLSFFLFPFYFHPPSQLNPPSHFLIYSTCILLLPFLGLVLHWLSLFLLSWLLCLLWVIYSHLKNLELGSTNETEYSVFVCLALSLLPRCNNSWSLVTVVSLWLSTAFGSCSYSNVEAPCTLEYQKRLEYKLLKVRQCVLFVST